SRSTPRRRPRAVLLHARRRRAPRSNPWKGIRAPADATRCAADHPSPGVAAYCFSMASRAQAWRLTEVPPRLAEAGRRGAARIATLLDDEIARWRAVAPALSEPLVALRGLVQAGGKRLRPAFCHWAYVGAGGAPDDEVVVEAGAALELLHTFALVHDDVMDGSSMRRGRPASHRDFMTRHGVQRGRGEARRDREQGARPAGSLR